MKNSKAQDDMLKDAKEHLDKADCYIVATKRSDHFRELDFPEQHVFIDGEKGLPGLCVGILECVFDSIRMDKDITEAEGKIYEIIEAVRNYIARVYEWEVSTEKTGDVQTDE